MRKNYTRNNKRAFTLIELMLVIAIIGILATIVLANLSNSKKKASDGTIMSQLKDARLQAEVYKEYGGNSSYTGVCTDPEFLNLYHGATKAYGGTFTDVCHEASGGTAWAAYVPLKNPPTGTTGWCVDSTDIEKAINGNLGGTAGTVTVCP